MKLRVALMLPLSVTIKRRIQSKQHLVCSQAELHRGGVPAGRKQAFLPKKIKIGKFQTETLP